MAPKTCAQGQRWCGPRGQARTRSGGSAKSSAMPTPRGFFGRGFNACRTSSGTSTVRAQ